MPNNELGALTQLMREFADTRDWNQFHSPKNLAMALSIETAEIMEHFQWLTEEQSAAIGPKEKVDVSHELADTLLYLVRLSDVLGIDLYEAAVEKMKVNNEKYPVEKSRGNAKKYTEFV